MIHCLSLRLHSCYVYECALPRGVQIVYMCRMVKDNEIEFHSCSFKPIKQQHLPFISIAAEGSDEQCTQYTECARGDGKLIKPIQLAYAV